MADNATLSFTVAGVTPTQLDILVKNTGAEPLSKALMIELKIPIYLVSKQIKDAVERADKKNQNQRTTASKESLANVVTAATGWSTWAATERTESLAVVRLYNDLSQTGTKVEPASFAAGTEFKLTIPLSSLDKPVQVEIPYSYRYPNEGRSGIQTDGKLKMTSSGSTTKSKVTLTTTHPSPTAIQPGTKLLIEWEVENGISATLYGPLPNGISQMQFSSDEAATNKIRKGSIELYAVGAATYVLQAVVPGATPKSDEMVVRTLQLAVKSADNYSYLGVRPPKVMPHGTLEVDWAVWGIEKTWLSVGNDYEIELNLTEQDINQAYQGSGIWRVVAPQAPGTVSALLELQVEKKRQHSKTVEFIVAAWQHDTVSFSGKPVGLAVKAPKLALLTTEALLLAEVGFSDSGPLDLDFKRVAIENAKAQLAIAATDTGFVVLQQTNKDGLQLVRYLDDGTRDGLPVDLPDTVQQLVRSPHKTFDLTFRKRIFVAAESQGENGYRRVFSLPNTAKPQIQREPLLESLHGYRLLVFDSALFAVSQGTGRMFRFQQDDNGKLGQPREAARAVKNGTSMIHRGLMIPVGRVLVVLCPSSIPLVDTMDVTGMLMYLFLKRPKAKIAQDLVYNPQQDQWIPCGRGLEVQQTSVAAFRCSASKRLYVVDPDGKAHSLAGAVEHLFVPQFIDGLSSQDLPPYFGTRKYTIKNDTGIHFEQMKEVYRKAGFDDFSAHGMAEVIEAPREFINRNTETFEFRCNEATPGAMTLRYLAYVPEGVAHDYMLEIHFSTDHSSIMSVIKRLAIDEQGMISVAEIPGTMVKHDPSKPIVLPPASSLTKAAKLKVISLSGYLFAVRHPLEPINGEFSNENQLRNPIEIDYKTPLFTVFVTDAGELRFDVDFTLPKGIEISPRSTRQTKQIRIDPEKAGKFNIDSISFKEPDEYECAIRYREKKNLEALYIGDGVASEDGKSIYLPIANPENPSRPQVWQIDTGTLVTIASVGFQGKDIFSVPNSIALLKDRLVAMLEEKNVAILDHSLQIKYIETLSNVTAVPVMAGFRRENALGFLCLNEPRPGKYNYFYSRKHVSQDRLIDDGNYPLDSLPSAGPQNRPPGIPAWLSDSNCAPMVVKLDATMAAICIKGGLLTIDTRREFEPNVIRIESAGGPEAIMYASNGQIFCAHSHVNEQSLLVTRIGFTSSDGNKSISLPGPVVYMNRDTRQLEAPTLQTKDVRAVSMLEPAVGAICVSHGKNIYLIKKENMSVEASVTVDLPCRLIRVKHEWPPHGRHEIFGGAAPCWIVYAIGADYAGSGGRPQSRWKTELYKLGFDKRT